MCDYIEEHTVKIDKQGFESATNKLESLINDDVSENTLQKHIENHPYILSQQFSHCHHVFPKVALGNQYETDFICLDIPSSGKEWIGVELEIPGKNVITKSGRKTADLEHAIQQIRDWRSWVTENLDYARKDKAKNGLGLSDIIPRFSGFVIIGRRKEFTSKFNELRKQIFRDELIEIRSWDGIIEWAYKRAKVFSYFVDSQNIIKMQQDLSEKQNEMQNLKNLINEVEHLEEKNMLLDEIITLRERELDNMLLKLEDDFSDEARKIIYIFIDSSIPHETIFENVKDSISPDITYKIFNNYLLAKKKNRKIT